MAVDAGMELVLVCCTVLAAHLFPLLRNTISNHRWSSLHSARQVKETSGKSGLLGPA